MPIAPTGPRDLLLFRSESSRHSRPRMTVAPEATTGGNAPRSAPRMAMLQESSRFSSSLNRLISSRA